MMLQLLSKLQEYFDALDVDVDTLLSCVTVFASVLFAFIRLLTTKYKEYKDGKEKKMFELYCKMESDNFYVYIMFAELGIILLSAIGITVIDEMIVVCLSFWGNQMNLGDELKTFIFIAINIVFDKKMIKMKWVRKKLVGDKEGKIIVMCSVFLINIELICINLNGNIQYLANICMLFYLLIEIVGLLHFQGKYIQYDFSSLRLSFNNNESIICEDIEKVSRKKKYIIIENKDKNIVLQYDKIWKVEYYGPPKIIIKEDIEKKFLQYIKRLVLGQKRKNNK